jgi:membrane protease YdiL (CAAX protease family)
MPGGDAGSFEAELERKIAGREDLQAIAALPHALVIVLCLAGVWVLYRLFRSAAWRRDWKGGPPAPRGRARDAIAAGFALLIGWNALAGLAHGREALELSAGQVLANVASIAVVAALAVAAVAWRERSVQALGLPGPAPERAAHAGVVAFLAAFPLYFAAEIAARWLFESLGIPRAANPAQTLILRSGRAGDVAALALTAAFLAPIAEEVLFRGFVFAALRRRAGFPAALAASSALFAAVHPPVDWLPIFVLSVALATVYDQTGSLFAPIVAHAANNCVGVVLLLAERYLARA